MLCDDEQIVPFKGKSSLKQYNPKKLKKWCYKICVMCDSAGIVYNFFIYTGTISAASTFPDIGASGNAVLQLAQIIPKNKNYLLYFDNWFCSIKLQVILAKIGIF